MRSRRGRRKRRRNSSYICISFNMRTSLRRVSVFILIYLRICIGKYRVSFCDKGYSSFWSNVFVLFIIGIASRFHYMYRSIHDKNRKFYSFHDKTVLPNYELRRFKMGLFSRHRPVPLHRIPFSYSCTIPKDYGKSVRMSVS